MINARKCQEACTSCGAKPSLDIEVGPSANHSVSVRLCAACFQQTVDLATGLVDVDKAISKAGGTREVTPQTKERS